MKRSRMSATGDGNHSKQPIGLRASRAALLSGRVTLYWLAIAAAAFALRPGLWKEGPGFAIFALSIASLLFLTYFWFGVRGYTIRGDSLDAPHIQVWGFVMLVAVVALVVFLWVVSHN
jgi:hypothetical protein